ncbi:MAG: hypothetical protein ACTSYG_06810, partial [Candidatus Heimdallarchaeota archaeon]
ILIIYKNGIPLFSVNFDEELDSTLTAGFITAITNFNEEHTVYLQQLIEHSFKNLKTLSYDAIISETITLVNERILLPVKSEEDVELEEYQNIDD